MKRDHNGIHLDGIWGGLVLVEKLGRSRRETHHWGRRDIGSGNAAQTYPLAQGKGALLYELCSLPAKLEHPGQRGMDWI